MASFDDKFKTGDKVKIAPEHAHHYHNDPHLGHDFATKTHTVSATKVHINTKHATFSHPHAGIMVNKHLYTHIPYGHLVKEEIKMTRFVDLASDKNASDFQQQLEQAMDAKAGLALDARKASIASSLFGEETPVVEETQQIDELSKGTLSSYVRKAGIGQYTAQHLPKKQKKRLGGIIKAASKLAK